MQKTLGALRRHWLVRMVVFLLALYVFLGAIETFQHAMGLLSKDAVKSLFSGLDNPFAGLAVGILSTALVQSSSVTTSLVVAMVGTGDLSLANAVPIVMGANIGTSITCALVSLGHITQSAAFRRAFAGATVHDIFNLLSVAILLPTELATGMLQRTAELLVHPLLGAGTGLTFESPVKTAVKWFPGVLDWLLQDNLGLAKPWVATVLFVLALVMVISSLILITRMMRVLMADRIERWINRVLRRSGLLGLIIGTVVTALVQSSSITTSLLIPMFGAGVLTLEAGFPITLGANIGTTVTAILAATVAGPAGLAIALVHLLFNLAGTLIFFPIRPMRRIPIRLAEKLADLCVRNRIWVVVYLAMVFVLLPLAGIILWKG